MLHKFLTALNRGQELSCAQAVRRAKTIVALEETEGWQNFEKQAQGLIDSMTPDIHRFTQEDATVIASQMAFISGIKRCLGLVQQQKDLLTSISRPDDN